MNVLFLSAWCPFPADNGVKLRTYHLLQGLSRSHTIDLVSFCPEGDDGAKAAHLRTFCHEVRLLDETPFAGRRVSRLKSSFALQPHSTLANHSSGMSALARQQAAAGRYDLVLSSELHMLPYALPLGLPIVFEDLELAHLHSQLRQSASPRRRMRAALTWWKTSRYLRIALRHVAGVSVVSEEERAIVNRLVPHDLPLAVVPNGVDLQGCAGDWPAPAADTLIYPGSLSYDANFDAVGYFLEDIWPRIKATRPAARFMVTGRADPEQLRALPRAEGVEFTGYLPDVRPAVARAWAEVVPLRKGSGTRLKILEALALGTPVITTAKGIEGLDLRPEAELLLAETAAAFAGQTLRLLASPELRSRLAEQGRQAVARYDWAHAVGRLEALLERSLGRRPRRSSHLSA